MFKILTFLFLILQILNVCGQVNGYSDYEKIYDLYQDNKTSEIGTSFNTFFSSSSITSDFIQALYGKEFIDNDLKNLNKPKDINNIGSQDFINTYYYQRLKSLFGIQNAGIRISAYYQNIRDIQFTDDFYHLMFYGNKDFAGKHANLSNCRMNLLTIQGIRFGIFQQAQFNDHPFYYYAGLSLIKGQDYQSVNIKNSSIFTAETGEFIDLDLNATYHLMDTSMVKFEDINGVGVAADFYFLFTNEEKHYKFDISITNLGFIRWKNEALTFNLDTIFRFEGLVIPNVFEFEDSSYFSMNTDSLVQEFYNKADTGRIIKALPERLHIRFTKNVIPDKLSASAGLSYLYYANEPIPYCFLSASYKPKDYLNIQLYSGYGGYGTYHLGIGCGLLALNKNLRINIASTDILGLLIPKNSFSQNIFLNLVYRFGNNNAVSSM